MGERLGWIDALRGYAAGVVLLFHLGPWILGTGTHLAIFRVFDCGKYAVLLFFLVSGYLIPASLERRGSLRRFWITRLFRIYPVYLAAIAALIVTSAAVPPVLRSATGLLGHATMLTDLLGLRGALRPFWTLTYEMVFYLMVAGLFACRLHRHSAAVAGALAVAAMLPLPNLLEGSGGTVTSSRQGLLLIATMFAGAALRSSRSLPAPASVALGLTTVVQPAVVVAVVVTFAAFFALRERPMPRALTALGAISYSLYLTHIVVLQAFARFLPGVAERPFLVRGVATAACAVCALAAARCAYVWIERPMHLLGHRIGTQRAAPRTARRVNGTRSV
ncbi:acyltransferase [Actinoplanes sp. NBRC 103695]|uniref:acyltransferase family protein n=1 Tax=Actinoplanes sp. NBRC 103695 TaxID=3032202 RepID=UPI0024A3B446|nr:acyltransferase [Actinoplanes sp. NBRC 103695]GLZ00617.1 acyltransferase [Actinoplanes sp. NBRC 103695]